MPQHYEMQKVGTDAELFLRNKTTNRAWPVIGKLGGNKAHPLQIKGMAEGFSVQEDNVAAEFNIPPAGNAKEFSDNIFQVLQYLTKEMADKNLELAIQGSMHFDPDLLRHPQAMTFGCDPDLNAWTGEQNTLPKWHPLLISMRTAAAHIHVSYTIDGKPPETALQRALAVRAHDLFIGVPSIILDPDKERREIYGKAGAFRITNYGHEYRTVGNFWIKTPNLRGWVFNQTKKALAFISSKEGEDILTNDDYIMQTIEYAINDHSRAAAEMLCHEFNVEIPD